MDAPVYKKLVDLDTHFENTVNQTSNAQQVEQVNKSSDDYFTGTTLYSGVATTSGETVNGLWVNTAKWSKDKTLLIQLTGSWTTGNVVLSIEATYGKVDTSTSTASNTIYEVAQANNITKLTFAFTAPGNFAIPISVNTEWLRVNSVITGLNSNCGREVKITSRGEA